ncbi:hypothetical protein HF086_009160 [Spodoptera exigua]|uniref:Uncharacterized protein n=1 Tax=Spodoptera exigua TaxID=7107 RepID=A0A922SNV7_SPOEX|nr:hypothetical protein HF086_009160 [Spodoptera exigua]
MNIVHNVNQNLLWGGYNSQNLEHHRAIIHSATIFFFNNDVRAAYIFLVKDVMWADGWGDIFVFLAWFKHEVCVAFSSLYVINRNGL